MSPADLADELCLALQTLEGWDADSTASDGTLKLWVDDWVAVIEVKSVGVVT